MNENDPATQIINFRYTFLPCPVILAVPVPRDEWRTVVLARIAIDYLAHRYTADIKKTFQRDIPSPLVVKLQDRREADAPSNSNLTNRPRRQAQFLELTDALLRSNTSLARYVYEHDDCIIDVSERPATRLIKYRNEKIAVFAAVLAIMVYIGADWSAITRQIALSFLGGYISMIITCKCKIYTS